jgi:prevent-host-death family protein
MESAAGLRVDAELLRCILEIEAGGMVSVTLLDGCGPEEAHYAADVVARSDAALTTLTVRYARTCCWHEYGRLRAAPTRQINIYDAKARLSRLVTEIEDTGQGIVIARHGRPVAELVPLRTTERRAPGTETAERCV